MNTQQPTIDINPTAADQRDHFKVTQYGAAVVLILSSICMAAYQVVMIDDIANGLLLYIAQAFLLAGSIFGLDYYVQRLTKK